MVVSSATAISLLVFILQVHQISAGGTDRSPAIPSASVGLDDRWVAEEEFHGASSSTSESQRRQLKRHKKDRTKDPQPLPSYPDGASESNSWWDEDEHESDDDGMLLQSVSPSTQINEGANNAATPRRHRLRVWKNGSPRKGSASSPTAKKSPVASSSSSPSLNESTSDIQSPALPTSEYDEEHPMRTDEWQLDVRLSRLFPKEEGELFPEYNTDQSSQQNHGDVKRKKKNSYYKKQQVMQFARNGYVKILEPNADESISSSSSSSSSSYSSTTTTTTGSKRKKPKVGKWKLGHSGVAFDIPVQVHVKRKSDNNEQKMQSRVTVLHYHADIHLNKFGERPRMFRGVITRDR